MRMHRVLTAIIALALLGFLPFVGSSSATARGAAQTGEQASAAASAAEKLSRDLNDKAVQRGEKYFIKGRATPEGGNKTVIFKRKTCKSGCAYKLYQKVRTDGDGRFSVRVLFPATSRPTWYYKGYMLGGTKYKIARTAVYTACSRISC